ncbi:MAG: hypothetical protein K2J50_00560 [Treponemataceae bacterium]|nr:hypothetical protein [Treponemataceae bacterium]
MVLSVGSPRMGLTVRYFFPRAENAAFPLRRAAAISLRSYHDPPVARAVDSLPHGMRIT